MVCVRKITRASVVFLSLGDSRGGLGQICACFIWVCRDEIDDLMTATSWFGKEELFADYFGVNTDYMRAFIAFPARHKGIFGDSDPNSLDFLELLESIRIHLASDPRDY